MGKENMMTMKSTLLVAQGVLFIAAPAAVQAQPQDSDGYYYDHPDDAYSHHRHHRRGCCIGRRGEYGHYRQRLTLICH